MESSTYGGLDAMVAMLSFGGWWMFTGWFEGGKEECGGVFVRKKKDIGR